MEHIENDNASCLHSRLAWKNHSAGIQTLEGYSGVLIDERRDFGTFQFLCHCICPLGKLWFRESLNPAAYSASDLNEAKLAWYFCSLWTVFAKRGWKKVEKLWKESDSQIKCFVWVNPQEKNDFHENKNNWSYIIFTFCSKVTFKFITLAFKVFFVSAYIFEYISFSSSNTLNSSQKRFHMFTDGIRFLNSCFMLKLVSLLDTSLLVDDYWAPPLKFLIENFLISLARNSLLNFSRLLSGPLSFYLSHTMLCYSYL